MYFASMKLRVTTSVKFASEDWLFGIYENRERSKNKFREITFGIRPVWGDSLSYLDNLFLKGDYLRNEAVWWIITATLHALLQSLTGVLNNFHSRTLTSRQF